jgi:ABC-type glycerol-3-phosphate transport system substrate-binding protein
MRTKKVFVKLAVIACIVFSSASLFAKKAPKGESEKITIKIWDWQVMENYMEAFDTILSSYMESHPNVTVQRTAIASGEFEKQFKAALAGGEAPDMFQVQLGIQVSAYYDAGILHDFYPDFKADKDWQKLVNYKEGHFGGYWIGEKLVVVPSVDQWVHAIYYYKDMLEKFGIKKPDTVDDLIKAAHTLKKNGIIPMSIAFGPNSIVWIPNCAVHELMMQYYGGDVLDKLETGKLSWEDPKIKACFHAMKKMQDNGVYPEDVNSAEYFPDVLTRYQNKQAFCFFPAGDWTIGSMNAEDVKNNNIGVMPWPLVEKGLRRGYGASAAIAYGMRPDNKNKDAVIDVIKHILSDKSTAVLLENGIHPISKTATTLPVTNTLMKEVLRESTKPDYFYSPFMLNRNPEIGRREIDNLGKLFTGMMSVDEVCADLEQFTKDQLE